MHSNTQSFETIFLDSMGLLVDPISMINWNGAFGILEWQNKRVSVIKIHVEMDLGANVYSVMEDGSLADPATLTGDEALSQWLRDCFARRH